MKLSDSSKIIARIAGLHDQYKDEIVYYNYPGLLFYLSPSFTWLSTQLQKYYGAAIPFFKFYFKEGNCFFEHPSYLGPGELIMNQLRKDGLGWVKKSKKKIKEAEQFAGEWLNNNQVAQGKTLPDYIKLLQESNKVYLKTHIPFQIAVHIDRHLKKQLSEIFQESKLKWEDISELCIPKGKSAIILHDKEVASFREWCRVQGILLNIGSYKKNINNPSFMKQLKKCYIKGYFLHAGFGGVNLWAIKDEYEAVCKNSKLQKEIMPATAHALTHEQRKWVTISRYFVELRERKKILQSHFYFYQAQILEEIAKIISISRTKLEYLCIEQFNEKFLNSTNVRKTIAEQKLGYFIYWEPAKGFNIQTGEEAIKTHKAIYGNKEAPKEIELKGISACKGKATGHVKIVLNPRQGLDFNEGDILITGMTSPDFVLLMNKAAAIVTELGGITCHAAIVAREMGKPCIISTKIATKVFKDGDLVEVDADKGIVRKLS